MDDSIEWGINWQTVLRLCHISSETLDPADEGEDVGVINCNPLHQALSFFHPVLWWAFSCYFQDGKLQNVHKLGTDSTYLICTKGS